jgi:hypothetical protein
MDASVAEARAAAPLRCTLPVVVVSRDTRTPPGNLGPVIAAAVAQHKLPAVVPRNFGYIDDRAWDKAQDALARLVPGARHVVVTSGHNIQIEHPRAVIGPIHDVVVTARRQQGHLGRLQSQCRRSGAPR